MQTGRKVATVFRFRTIELNGKNTTRNQKRAAAKGDLKKLRETCSHEHDQDATDGMSLRTTVRNLSILK